MRVNIANGIISAEAIQVNSTIFLNRVTIEPAAKDGLINSLLIADHAGLAVVVLRAEAEGEHIGEETGGFSDVAVRVVGVLRGNRASLRNVENNVSVVVVARNVADAVHRHGEQTADSARALLPTGLVQAPEVLKSSGRAVGELDFLQDDVVAVPDESMGFESLPLIRPGWWRGRRCARGMKTLHCLADSAVAVVVGIQHTERAVRHRP